MIDGLHQASAFGGDDVLTFAAGSAFADWLRLVEKKPATDAVLDRLQRSAASATGLRDVLSFETGTTTRRLAATTARQIDQREHATASAGRALPFGARRTSNDRRLAVGGRNLQAR